jgi:type IV secretion system protein VirB9
MKRIDEMIKATTIFLLAFVCTATSAFADSAPPKADPRIQHFAYDADNVYKLDLYLKSVAAVQFSETEDVQSILIGDSASWEVVKLNSGNVISIKPITSSATTNMTVYTNNHVYTFELHCLGELGADAAETPPFRAIFTYPQEAKPTKPVTERVVAAHLDFDYLVSGQAAFRPLRVQDDGRHTTFTLPEGAPRPAIFKVAADHQEQLINSRTVGSRITVDGVNDFWVLRIGDQAVCVGRGNAVHPTSPTGARTEAKNASMEIAHGKE